MRSTRTPPSCALPRLTVRPILALVLAVAALTGCDTGTASDADVLGLWVGTASGLTVYIQISESSVTVWQGLDGVCFNTRSLSIVSRDGDDFTLQETGSVTTLEVVFGRDGDGITSRNLISTAELSMEPSDQDLSGVEACEVLGTWGFEDDGFASTVVLTETTFTAYDGNADGCRSQLAFTITDQDGAEYSLQDASGGRLDLEIVNQAGTLVVTFPGGGSLSYTASTEDPTTIDVCGGGDESATACADLPQIAVGGTVDGELSSSDPVSLPEPGSSSGWYFDLYGLTLDSEQQVQIDLVSDVIDPRLLLWDADGDFLAENDDNGTSFNSTIVMTLAAACYIVEATSFGIEETGAYTLTVN